LIYIQAASSRIEPYRLLGPVQSSGSNSIGEVISAMAFLVRRLKELYRKNRALQDHLLKLRHVPFYFRQVAPLDRPIFLTGTVRSSTTLVAKCLRSHPRVCYPQLHHFELSPNWCELADIEISVPGTRKQTCPPLTAADATEDVCRRVRTGFARIHAVEGGSADTRLLNKNPHLWNKLPFIHRIFPEACLIVTSRDIVSTVASTRRLWNRKKRKGGIRHYLPPEPDQCWQCIWPDSSREVDPTRTFPDGNISTLAAYWLRVHQKIERDAALFKQSILVQHRNFIENPWECLNRTQEAMGLPLCEFPIPRIDPSRNSRWRDLLSTAEQQELKAFIDENHAEIQALKFADTTIVM